MFDLIEIVLLIVTLVRIFSSKTLVTIREVHEYHEK